MLKGLAVTIQIKIKFLSIEVAVCVRYLADIGGSDIAGVEVRDIGHGETTVRLEDAYCSCGALVTPNKKCPTCNEDPSNCYCKPVSQKNSFKYKIHTGVEVRNIG